MKIKNKYIGRSYKPFIVAEMSGNHNQSLTKALKIVEYAASIGAHALKLQTYTAETITLDVKDDEFYIQDKNSIWKNKSLYDLYKQAYTPWEWHKPILQRANELDLICFSTPFDETAVDFLEELNVPAYKIASFENIHLPLIEKVASTGKPMIISCGMASIAELYDIVNTVRNFGSNDFVLLKCTSTYPASPKNSNILTIPHMRELFKCEVGLSDHTLGIGAAIAAVAHGATVIEKHFTINRADGGIDSTFSMEPSEMKNLIKETLCAWQSLGKVKYGFTKSELKSAKFRRSIYAVEDINAGNKLTTKNIRCIRPGFGLKPKYYKILLGMNANKDIKKGSPINWEIFKNNNHNQK